MDLHGQQKEINMALRSDILSPFLFDRDDIIV